MKRVSKGHGYFLSLILNLLINPECLVIGIILFVLSFYTKIPMWCSFIALGIWILYALIITTFFFVANRAGNYQAPVNENKNPYSNIKPVMTSPDKLMSKDPMCPCCNRYRFDEAGKYEICPICKWEDDPMQRAYPDYEGGANKMSLNKARAEYMEREGKQ